MIDYPTLFGHVRGLAKSWQAADLAAGRVHQEALDALTPDQLAELVEALCSRAGRHVEEIGADAVGDLVWYLMGAGRQVWFEVAKAEPGHATDAVLGLRRLYEHCFARHLTDWRGVGEDPRPLGTACYMLWDMDGGLDVIPRLGRPEHLVPACYQVLEHALSLDAPACWESALHGLGHIVFRHPDPGRAMIDRFLETQGRHVPEALRRYAASARTGCVQ